ncbi:hypothetical protein FDP41_005098 [Naegleria fowleri]|uniref:Uncharacterized protein n=1 Tax=Naegleria fowleri TaxID=5763 RepID=A0A6A5BNA6_NAEFO|nr:uncharacterized protein FDP41_005098 [Naegleria fowleri]KAF0975771.1 hypothetical protein FDP41_005098 [Naegleria fowleri]
MMGIMNRFVEKDYCHVYKADMAESGFYDLYSDFIIGLVDPKYVFLLAFDTVSAAKQLHSLILYSNDRLLREILLSKYEVYDVSTLDFFEQCCIYYLQETGHSLNQKIGIDKKYSRNRKLKQQLELLDDYIRNNYKSILQWIREKREDDGLDISSLLDETVHEEQASTNNYSTPPSSCTTTNETRDISHEKIDLISTMSERLSLFKAVLVTTLLMLLLVLWFVFYLAS